MRKLTVCALLVVVVGGTVAAGQRDPLRHLSAIDVVVENVGGGGGNGGGVFNNSPVAFITGSPATVPLGDNHTTVVTLDGSSSVDPDGDALSFAWTVPNGRFVGGTTDTDSVIQVTFPGVAPYTVILVVSDGRGGIDTAAFIVGIT